MSEQHVGEILSFNGVALTAKCKYCEGAGAVKAKRVSCPTCDKEIQPVPITDEDFASRPKMTGDTFWKCPECGEGFGSGQDWGLEPVWCIDCEGCGRDLTEAGKEFLTFLDVYRPRN